MGKTKKEIQKDEKGVEEVGFKDIAIAEKFVHTMGILSRLYRREKTLFTMQMLADIMKIMSDNNLINVAEMYNLSEKEVIDKIILDKMNESPENYFIDDFKGERSLFILAKEIENLNFIINLTI